MKAELDATDKELKAKELVDLLKIESDSDILASQERRLVELGLAAEKHLRDFLATEGKPQKVTDPETPRPSGENYAAARRVLRRLGKEYMQTAEGCVIEGSDRMYA